ncbi:hypothetical protein CLOSTHATH_02205 [Hungatella hathewayi DSM 13479]|uniref:Uncharacterized protein n=1 Tax=Hungatella hathewayi DSM 13479 TaxID=566550 RepID=D3AF21_9FIRM|nr:hypothetical protein CLOSTHATH_02205 [Hungatella hathewayi DSM 13479]
MIRAIFYIKCLLFFIMYFTICIKDDKIQICKRLHIMIMHNNFFIQQLLILKDFINLNIFKRLQIFLKICVNDYTLPNNGRIT